MNQNNFYIVNHKQYNIIFHIPSSRLIKLKKETNIYYFFRQLLLNEKTLNPQEFLELQELITDQLPFLKKENSKKETLGNINFQSITLPISGHCNLRCSYCFAQNKGDFGFKDIDIPQAKKITDYILKNNDPKHNCQINFFGGEPLLNTSTMEAVISHVKTNYSNRKVIFGITTNGTILNDKILNLIKKNNIKILLSYDGPMQLGSHRKYINGKHTSSKVLKNIEILKKEGISLQLRATIPSDCESMKDLYDHFESLSIPFAAVLAYKSRNNDETCIFNKRLNFFKEQYKTLLDFYINRVKNKLPINCYSITNDLNLIKVNGIKEFSCGGGVNLFSITDKGNIFSCEHLAFSDEYKIGNINTGINKEVLKTMQPKNVNEINDCKNCWIRYLCSGGCFSEKLLVNQQSKKQLEEECKLKRLYWDFILNLYTEIEANKVSHIN